MKSKPTESGRQQPVADPQELRKRRIRNTIIAVALPLIIIWGAIDVLFIGTAPYIIKWASCGFRATTVRAVTRGNPLWGGYAWKEYEIVRGVDLVLAEKYPQIAFSTTSVFCTEQEAQVFIKSRTGE